MTPQEAHEVLKEKSPLNVGKFYGNAGGVALGAGLIYEKILTPLFSQSEQIYLTARQPVYVLSHECDVDPSNNRPFNDSVSFCPVIPVASFLRRFESRWPQVDQLISFLSYVAMREVGRVVYLPPGPGFLQFGGFIYLNHIASADVSCFQGQQPTAALSHYGLQEMDMALCNSLLRPKSDALSFGPTRSEHNLV